MSNDLDDFNKYEKFVKENLEKTNSVKLVNTKHLDDLPDIVIKPILAFYTSTSSSIQKSGSIINSIYTQQTNVFLLSLRIVSELVKNDPNIKYTSCNSTNYKEIMHKLFSSKVITALRKPSGKFAGLYELTSEIFLEPLRQQIGDDMLEATKKEHIEWYDSGREIKNNQLRKDIEETRIARKAYDEQKNRINC